MGLDYFRKGIGTDLKLRGFIKALLVLAFIGSFFYLLFSLNFAAIYNFLYRKTLSLVPEFMDKKENLDSKIPLPLHEPDQHDEKGLQSDMVYTYRQDEHKPNQNSMVELPRLGKAI